MGHFEGTAEHYAAFRPDYPASVWDLLVPAGPIGGVLDLGCGPGTASFPLADRAGQVIAVDAEQAMVDAGQQRADERDIDNIDWRRSAAEDLTLPAGSVDLVVIASAFHWMDRPTVAARCRTWLRAGGRIALLGNPTPLMETRGEYETPVGRALAEVQQRWFADDYYAFDVEELARPETVLEDAGFHDVRVEDFPHTQAWDVDRYIGFLRSTSSRPDQRLGDRWSEFAADTADAIRSVAPSGEWTVDIPVELISATS